MAKGLFRFQEQEHLLSLHCKSNQTIYTFNLSRKVYDLSKGSGFIQGKAERDVPEHHRHAENEAQRGDLEELDAGSDHLHRDHLHPRDGDVAEQRACRHVAQGEEDRVLEPVVAQQVLVEEQDSDVRRVPRRRNFKPRLRTPDGAARSILRTRQFDLII
ncbi:hypothetical protein YC2023_039458 [Brassica napus]